MNSEIMSNSVNFSSRAVNFSEYRNSTDCFGPIDVHSPGLTTHEGSVYDDSGPPIGPFYKCEMTGEQLPPVTIETVSREGSTTGADNILRFEGEQ